MIFTKLLNFQSGSSIKPARQVYNKDAEAPGSNLPVRQEPPGTIFDTMRDVLTRKTFIDRGDITEDQVSRLRTIVEATGEPPKLAQLAEQLVSYIETEAHTPAQIRAMIQTAVDHLPDHVTPLDTKLPLALELANSFATRRLSAQNKDQSVVAVAQEVHSHLPDDFIGVAG